MRKIFALLITSLSIGLNVFAQNMEFAPEGAIWHYSKTTYIGPGVGTEDYITLKCEKDTLYEGRECKYMTSHTMGSWFVYKEDSRFYVYDGEDHGWQTLYDFNLKEGDSFLSEILSPTDTNIHRVFIEEIFTDTLNGEVLKAQYFSSQGGNPAIVFDGYAIENIGSSNFFFPESHGNPDFSIRCYSDPKFGSVQFVSYPCDTTFQITGIKEIDEQNEWIQVQQEAIIIKENITQLNVYDTEGQLLVGERNLKVNDEIVLPILTEGVYIIETIKGETTLRSKWFLKAR